MGEHDLGPVAGPLLRARLHIRGGRRRLRQGKIDAGIAALYDALEHALQSCLADPAFGPRLDAAAREYRGDAGKLYRAFVEAGVLDGSFDFGAFDALTSRALNQELSGFDYHGVLAGLESVMTQLGVLPFDEASLPPEDPKTL